MPKLILERLVLRGFGLYGREVSANFLPGANVLVGTNESGKTTLAEGLCGVIFGLQPPSERFRSWGSSPSFEGELWLTSAAVAFHIKRWFDTDRIEVLQLVGAKWKQIVTGEHKTGARKPNQEYLKFLEVLFGFTSYDAFRNTFFVGQPMPEVPSLDAKVQELLSGGGLGHQEAKKLLVSELQGLTLAWDSFVPGLGRGRKDRDLEIVQKERRELETLLKAQDNATSSLELCEKRLRDASITQSALKRALTEQEDSRTLYQRWLLLRDKYAARRDKTLRMSEDVSRARHLSDAVAKEREELGGRALPALKQAYEDYERQLEKKENLKDLALLGEQPAETLRSFRYIVKVQADRQAELRLEIGSLQEKQRQAEKRANELNMLGESFELKYRVPLLGLAEDAPDILSKRDSLLAEKTKIETRLSEIRLRPRRTLWPAVVGFLLGLLLFLGLEGPLAYGAALLSSIVGTALSLFWHQKDPTTGMHQQAMDEVALALSQLEAQAPLVGKIDVAAAQLARKEIIDYYNLQKEIIAALSTANERVTEVERRYEDFLRRQEGGLPPRFFNETCTLLGVSTSANTTLLHLASIDEDNWADLEAKVEQYAKLRDELQRTKQQIAEIVAEAERGIRVKEDQLKNVLAIYQVEDTKSLILREMDYSTDMQLARKEWQDLVQGNPRLPALEQAGDARLLALWQEEIEHSVAQTRGQLTTLESEIRELTTRQGFLSGQQTVNIAQGEELVLALSAQEEQIKRKAKVLGLAITAMQNAATEFHMAARSLLEDRSTFHFRQIAGKERQVKFSEDFTVSVLDTQGKVHSLEVLSHGTRDQLYLSLRLAIADLVGAEREIPLIFDDPFLTTDSERQGNFRSALERLGRQSLLLSHSAVFEDWGNKVRVSVSSEA